jgi:hypothetical protein
MSVPPQLGGDPSRPKNYVPPKLTELVPEQAKQVLENHAAEGSQEAKELLAVLAAASKAT